MLIPFTDCLKYCSKDIRGIIHCGAHRCEEKFTYNLHGISNIIWVEAMQNLVDEFKKDNKIYQLVVSDKDNEEVIFHISNNGQSSSILDFGTHKKNHPDVHFIKDLTLKTTRMDTFIKREHIDIKEFNFINLDLQGIELRALKSFGNLLENIDYIYSEVNDAEVYIGCDLITDIDNYLSTFGFKRVITKMAGNTGWGDAMYIKN
jgi:FkbM family methyltransferase